MFFLKNMDRTITLHPQLFGPRVNEILTRKLKDDVEGVNMGNFYIVCIMDRTQISEGRIVPGSGYAQYTVSFRAVVWRPFRGEVLDGTVGSVLNVGFYVEIGPMSAFVAKAMIPADFIFDGNATPPVFANTQNEKIEKGTRIRIKMIGVRAELGDMYGIGTIKEDYLGPLMEDA